MSFRRRIPGLEHAGYKLPASGRSRGIGSTACCGGSEGGSGRMCVPCPTPPAAGGHFVRCC
jgi:hypothetical protein